MSKPGSKRAAPAPPPPPTRRTLSSIVAAEPALALVPLRAFLGVTFCFAGLQKLANPNFFRAASPVSIQAQLVAAQRSSPLGHLLHPLMSASVPIGVVIALGELAVGLGVLTGVLIRLAAAGGMVISLVLFLTVSFHSRPFYTGADIGYFFAFTPFLLAGAGTLSLPAAVDGLVPLPSRPRRRPRPGIAGLADRLPVDQGRRDALVAGALAGAGVVLAAVDAGLGRLAGGAKPPVAQIRLGDGSPLPTTLPASAAQASTSTTAAPSEASTTTATGRAPGSAVGTTPTSPPPQAPTTTTSKPAPAPTTRGTTPRTGSSGSTPTTTPAGGGVPGGTRVGPAADVPVGGSASFQDPSSGDPAIVIQAKAGQFVAFDAVCPHAGCTVGYASSHNVIVCPCHGSLFNAATGAVEQGPAASNLRTIRISEGGDGNLYVL